MKLVQERQKFAGCLLGVSCLKSHANEDVAVIKTKIKTDSIVYKNQQAMMGLVKNSVRT